MQDVKRILQAMEAGDVAATDQLLPEDVLQPKFKART